jgi:hypothetical protein
MNCRDEVAEEGHQVIKPDTISHLSLRKVKLSGLWSMTVSSDRRAGEAME